MKLGALIQVTSGATTGPGPHHFTGANPEAWKNGAPVVYRHYAKHILRRGDTVAMVWRNKGLTVDGRMPMFPPLRPVSDDPVESALADVNAESEGLSLLRSALDYNASLANEGSGELIVYDGYLNLTLPRTAFDRQILDRVLFLIRSRVTTWAIDGSALGGQGSLTERAALIWLNKGGERFMVEAFPRPDQKHWRRPTVDACANAVNAWNPATNPDNFPGRMAILGSVKVDVNGQPVRHPDGWMYGTSNKTEEREFSRVIERMGYDLHLTGLEDGISNL